MRPFSPQRRWLRWIAMACAALAVLAALPVLYVETQCKLPLAQTDAAALKPILPPADRRDEVNTYLTYPEWSIVHAYEDLAAVTRRGSESNYDYFGAVARYWTSLCAVYRTASQRGTISGEYKLMLHIIGLSFAGEMGIKGAWEKTVGRLTASVRGQPTPEDQFALALADDYATFLKQTPWYEYPFGTKLWRFWADTPLFSGNIIRKIERRIALSMEWGSKALYSKLIGFGAAASPAPLRIKSVVQAADATALTTDPRIKIISPATNGGTIIETDRYRTFTEILIGLAKRGVSITEIAGNRSILVTVLAPETAQPYGSTGTRILFRVPYAVKPGWVRTGYVVPIESLTPLIQSLSRPSGPDTGVQIEHIYDY